MKRHFAKPLEALSPAGRGIDDGGNDIHRSIITIVARAQPWLLLLLLKCQETIIFITICLIYNWKWSNGIPFLVWWLGGNTFEILC